MTTAPRILQVCSVYFTYQKFLHNLCRDLSGNGFDVHLACSPPEDKVVHDLTFHPIFISRSYSPLNIIRAFFQFYKLFNKEKFDIIHVHTPLAALVARFASIFCPTRIVVYTAHGFYFHENMPFHLQLIHIFLERVSSIYTSFIFTQSLEDAEFAVSHKFKNSHRILAIGNGVITNAFASPDLSLRSAFFSSHSILPTDVVIGIVARKVSEKGYLDLFNACRLLFESYSHVKLLICGERLASDYAGSIQDDLLLLDSLYPGRVIDLGYRDDMANVYSFMDIFCLPSYREGMPRSIIEAMASSLPVVATNIRGSREEVLHGTTGFLVSPRNHHELSLYLSRLIESPELRHNFGHAGRHRACTLYDEKLVINKQITVFNRLLGLN